MGHQYTVVFELEPDPLDMAFLEERMAEAAVSAAGVGEEQEFAVIVRDAGRIVAGASGSMWGGGCQVHVVWVDETFRHRGLGGELMAEVEHQARDRGCQLVMGLTYDVLIGDFYERLGYRTVGLIEDYPAGTSTRWYCKEIHDDQARPPPDAPSDEFEAGAEGPGGRPAVVIPQGSMLNGTS
jgi:GNAT superfamily N-acetyltransferase